MIQQGIVGGGKDAPRNRQRCALTWPGGHGGQSRRRDILHVRLAAAKARDFVLADIYADDGEPALGEGYGQGQPDISQPDHGHNRIMSGDLLQKLLFQREGPPETDAAIMHKNRPPWWRCGQGRPEMRTLDFWWCPRPDSNGHAHTGTGPQPAVYTNSTTGASASIIADLRALSIHSRRSRAVRNGLPVVCQRLRIHIYWFSFEEDTIQRNTLSHHPVIPVSRA